MYAIRSKMTAYKRNPPKAFTKDIMPYSHLCTNLYKATARTCHQNIALKGGSILLAAMFWGTY